MLKATALFFMLAALCGALQLSSIEGCVTNQSGEPLKNATVRLRMNVASFSRDGTVRLWRRVRTGVFSYKTSRPGVMISCW